jgi:hypothetical protein
MNTHPAFAEAAKQVYVEDVEALIRRATNLSVGVDELREYLARDMHDGPARQYADHLLDAAEHTLNALTALLRIEAQS